MSIEKNISKEDAGMIIAKMMELNKYNFTSEEKRAMSVAMRCLENKVFSELVTKIAIKSIEEAGVVMDKSMKMLEMLIGKRDEEMGTL